MNRRVLEVYKRVMALPEGLPSREYRKELRKQVRAIPDEVKQDILERSDEIDESSWETFFANKDILLALGFTESEAQYLARCRINSPGIRTLIKERVAITKYAKPGEIKMINEGRGSVINGLKMLYVRGGTDGELDS